jgi:phosphatidylinositol alpha-1,6-mannosyltransferase
VTHLLVTNDFPPKVGGIQSYLYELWRRLPPESFVVVTASQPAARRFDERQAFEVRRRREPVLLPTPGLVRELRRLAAARGVSLVVVDPALPLGLIGPRLGLPYAVVLHGAEATVPARLAGLSSLLRHVVGRASLVVAAGEYPAEEARRLVRGHSLPLVVVPPGVDVERFRPLDAAARAAARERFGVPAGAELVVSVSRLVPRKGIDVLVEASALLAPRRPALQVLVAGAGRDRPRLERLSRRLRAPIRFLGRLGDDEVPLLDGCADVWAMPCRNRWGGLEQEGFGIVFLEAAATGVPQVAGASGGAGDAVIDGETGLVVGSPRDAGAVAAALERLLGDAELRRRMGEAARARAVAMFDYGVLARRLDEALAAVHEPGRTARSPVARDRRRVGG